MPNFASKAAWSNYAPASNGWGGDQDPFRNPAVLVPFTFKIRTGDTLNFGKGHRLFVPIAQEALRLLEPHVPGGFKPDPDEGCFNPGSVTVGGDRSFHTFGLAADVEWNNNPMGPSRRPTGPQTLPGNTGAIIRPLGLQWGGDWTSPHDWMHFELHLNPGNARALIAQLRADAATGNKGRFPFGPGHYIGDIDGSAWSHGGVGSAEQHYVALVFQWLQRDGFWPKGRAIPRVFDGPDMAAAVRRFRRAQGWNDRNAVIGSKAWKVLANGTGKKATS